MRQVCVTRQRVLDHIKQFKGPLDTGEIAAALSTDEITIPERSVRAAVTWLILSGYLARHDTPIIRRNGGQPYKVWRYFWTGKDTPINTARKDRVVLSWFDSNSNNGGVFLDRLFLKARVRG